MKQSFRKLKVAVLIVAFALGPVPRPAAADDSIAKVKKVTILAANPKESKEPAYPTSLVQLVMTDQSREDVKKDTRVQPGQAVLTRSANTHVTLDKGLEAVLFSDTFVRFDGLNIWLLRHGRTYVVSKRGKLEIVAEALGRILVNSKVYLRNDGTQLLVLVTEGHVVLEANAQTLSLGPGQAGRLVSGEPPQATTLTLEEQAEVARDMETAKQVMKGGGGSGLVIGAALAAILAGAAIASSGGGGTGGGGTGGGGTVGGGTAGGAQGLPDLVPQTGDGCRFDDYGNVRVGVRNDGQADAPASITRVEFEQDSRAARRAGVPTAQDLETPPLSRGAASVVAFSARLLQSLRLHVTVDATGRVKESNEDNNTAVVTCPSPIR